METYSLYIHIPFCTSKCTYCDFFSIPVGSDFSFCEKTQKIFKDYVLALKKELEYYFEKFQIKSLKTIYIGGGTPSLLSVEQIQDIFNFISSKLKIEENAEITLEANPQDISEEFLEKLKKTPVNRLSLGIQCCNDNVLKSLERRCDINQVNFALDIIKNKWVSCGLSFSCDLISGLPFLSDEDFIFGLEKVISSGVNHISLYSLMIEDGTVLEKQISRNEIEYSDEKNDNQWILGKEFLEKKGFYQYEVSNFAKKGFESRHNTVYWRTENYLGCGAGATGTVDCFRWNNVCDVEKYCDFWLHADFGENFVYELEKVQNEKNPRIVEILSEKEKEFEFLMMGFRLREGVKSSVYKKRFGFDLGKRLGCSLDSKIEKKNLGVFDKWKEKKLCDVEKTLDTEDERFFLTGDGLLFLNQFLEELM